MGERQKVKYSKNIIYFGLILISILCLPGADLLIRADSIDTSNQPAPKNPSRYLAM
jgi:hypothetical protein